MATYLMAVMGISERGFFTPVNLVAAVFPPFRPVLSGFQPAAAAVGFAGHLAVSILWGMALGMFHRYILPNLFKGTWSQLSLGLALGFVAWAVTGLRVGPAIDPALDAIPAAHAFIAHLCYGIGTATVLWAWAGHAPDLRVKARPVDHAGGLGAPSR